MLHFSGHTTLNQLKKKTPIVYNDLILEVDRPNILGMQDINLYLTKNKNKNKQDQIQKNVVLY